jgi:tight adherence protein B
MLRDIAATARLGGNVAALGAHHGRPESALHGPFGRVARAWALAERHGVGLAELLDAVRTDLEHRAAFVRDVESKMAGPRATAAVLSGLPVLGVVLGETSGADPLGVLAGRPAGQVLLVVGTLLLCVGMMWTVRLTDVVVRS